MTLMSAGIERMGRVRSNNQLQLSRKYIGGPRFAPGVS